MLLSKNSLQLWREGHQRRARRLLGHLVPWHLLGTKGLDWTSLVTSLLLLQIRQPPFASLVQVCFLSASSLSGDHARAWWLQWVGRSLNVLAGSLYTLLWNIYIFPWMDIPENILSIIYIYIYFVLFKEIWVVPQLLNTSCFYTVFCCYSTVRV